MKNLVWKQPGNMFQQQHNHALEMSDYPFLHTKELGVVPKNFSWLKVATTLMNNKIFGIILVLMYIPS